MNKSILISLIILCFLIFMNTTLFSQESSPLLSENESSTFFAVGKYANNGTETYPPNLNLTKTLTIPNSDALEVSILGHLEKCCDSEVITHRCCDYITLYDSQDKEIGKFSAQMDEKFTVKGSSIRVDFKSDGRTEKEGVIVRIAVRLPAIIFNEIKEQLLDASHKILEYGTKEAYIKIQQNLRSFQTLHTTMAQSQELDIMLKQITDQLIAMAKTYKEVAERSPEISQVHQKQFKIISQLKTKTMHSIERIENKKQKYQSQFNNDQLKLDELEDPVEKQKLQYSIEGYRNIIQTMSGQKAIWDKFYQAQTTLEIKLRQHSQKIELLLHMLNINAKIYEESANFALLRKTTTPLRNVTNLSELREIVTDLEASEREIAQQIEKIEKTEI